MIAQCKTFGHAVVTLARLEVAVSVYTLSVFLHIVGALGLFASLGLEQASVLNLRRASTTAQVREWVSLLGALRRIEGPAAFLIVTTGFYLVATRWGHHAWIGLGLLGLVLMAVLGAAVSGRRATAIRSAVPDQDGPIPVALRTRLDDRVLQVSASLRAALAVGIVFNMSVKPGTAGAFTAMAAALALGMAVASAGWIGSRTAVQPSGYETES
jgi:hypothetical protein